MLRFVLPFLLAGCLFAGGCVTTQQTRYADIVALQATKIDSLDALNARLRQTAATFQDSLQFYDDIDSGRYYRALRTRDDRITRLEYDLAVCADGGRAVASLPVDELFKPASATLTPAGLERLDALVAQLMETYPESGFRVEGHSDSVPLGASLEEKFPSNWELSAARAGAVVRYLIETHELDPARLELVGHGASRPVFSNSTAEGRRRNRRVEVVLRPEAPEGGPRIEDGG